MTDMLDAVRVKLKENVTILINNNKLSAAQDLLIDAMNLMKEDIENYFLPCISAMREDRVQDVQKALEQSITLDQMNYYLKKTITHHVSKLPKVSVIIPTYNRKNMLKEALESVLAQDYPNIEIIVADNASTDGTVEIMIGYLNDSRIRYIRRDQNIGFTGNLKNTFFNYATGEYVMFLCDDDQLIDQKYISHAITLFLANPNVVLVHANCKILNVLTNEVYITKHKAKRITKGIDYFLNYEQAGYDHIIGVVTAIFNRQKAIDVSAMDIADSYGVDMILYLRLMLAGDVGVIDECAGLYLYHAGNISNSLDILELDATISELEKTKLLAINIGFDEGVMHKWLVVRVWQYAYWKICSYMKTGNTEAIANLLASIQLKYPEAWQAIKQVLEK